MAGENDKGVIGVASQTVGALTGTPILLVMILLNIAFLGAASYYLTNQQRALERIVSVMFERCLPNGDKG